VPITLRHLLVYAPQLSNVVGVYQDRSTAASLNITSGVNGPLDVAVDQNRTVYVANNSGGNVTTYPNASATPNAATYPGLSPTGVAIDSYGSLYVSDYGSGTVKQYLAGSTTANLTISGLTLPNRTAINSFGQVAVPDSGVGKMYLYSAGSTTASTNFSVSLPHGSFYDRAGDLWIPSGTKVIELLPGVTNQNAATLTITGFISAFAVAVDIAGYIYVADYEAGKVFVLPPGATSITNATETITGLSYPGGVAVWPN
jgi:serine/threonine-protein kinase